MTTDLSENIRLRRPDETDEEPMAGFCNNIKIWNNVRDLMPFPYSREDAADFIRMCQAESPTVTFAIEYEGKFSGCIGLKIQSDIYRLSAELGYWVGETFWCRGIATRAVELITDYGFRQLGMIRIFCGVIDYNKASQRVLEKSGYTLEAVCKQAVFKNGRICDEYRYAKCLPLTQPPSANSQ